MKKFEKGTKVRHIKAGEVVEVVRDEGGPKVVVKVDGVEISVLRDNLECLESETMKR